jgi:tRNA-specific 2-thiouridylase
VVWTHLVAAALLKEQGYEVIGMMLRLWSEPGKEDSNRCCPTRWRRRVVAAKLTSPFIIDAWRNSTQCVQYF